MQKFRYREMKHIQLKKSLNEIRLLIIIIDLIYWYLRLYVLLQTTTGQFFQKVIYSDAMESHLEREVCLYF